jgi:hypothetical protein
MHRLAKKSFQPCNEFQAQLVMLHHGVMKIDQVERCCLVVITSESIDQVQGIKEEKEIRQASYITQIVKQGPANLYVHLHRLHTRARHQVPRGSGINKIKRFKTNGNELAKNSTGELRGLDDPEKILQ